MKDTVFTSYAFGHLYVFQQERLRQSILKVYPDANIRFWHTDDPSSENAKGRPPGAKSFHESMYGFKVHCIRNCRDEGFKKVIFLDAAMILEGNISEIMKTAAELGILCTKENTDLREVTSDRCLEYCGLKREEMNLSLIGGSVYIFDFNNPTGEKVFEYWEAMERDGIFGSEGEACTNRLEGHRCDETCMSIAMAKYGVEPQSFDTVGYHNLGGGNFIRKFTFCKLHFKGVAYVQDHLINQSIIPIHGNILDLGCRDFVFTKFFKELEYNVYPVDIGEFAPYPYPYHQIAIAGTDGKCFVKTEHDPDATHITSENTGNEITMMTIESFSKLVGVKRWDVIKMDIEGAEYDILKNGKHPMASQITVEFHAHTRIQSKAAIDELLDFLEKYYHVLNREWQEKHSAGFNYWSVLLVSKEAIII